MNSYKCIFTYDEHIENELGKDELVFTYDEHIQNDLYQLM